NSPCTTATTTTTTTRPTAATGSCCACTATTTSTRARSTTPAFPPATRRRRPPRPGPRRSPGWRRCSSVALEAAAPGIRMTFDRCTRSAFARPCADVPIREAPMRSLFLRAGICLLLLLPAAAPAEDERLYSEAIQANCNIESDYRLQLDAAGVRLEAEDDAGEGLPALIAISGGTVRLDGVPQAVSDADAERLRGIEAGVRGMLPDMTAIAREAIAITFDALGGVNAALGGKRSEARRFRQMREDALARVEAMEARGEWSSELFGEEFEAEVE